jgi:hypothetical protein
VLVIPIFTELNIAFASHQSVRSCRTASRGDWIRDVTPHTCAETGSSRCTRHSAVLPPRVTFGHCSSWPTSSHALRIALRLVASRTICHFPALSKGPSLSTADTALTRALHRVHRRKGKLALPTGVLSVQPKQSHVDPEFLSVSIILHTPAFRLLHGQMTNLLLTLLMASVRLPQPASTLSMNNIR